MRAHLTAWLLNAVLLCPTAVGAATSNLYVFGDSLSDNGRGADVLGADYRFPYSSIPAENINRVSNGPVAVEKTASLLGLPLKPALLGSSPAAGTNYAVVGARANPIGLNTLGGQISAFQDNHPGGAPSDALYLVFIAGNDVLDIKDETSDFVAALAIDLATQGVESAVETLIDAGAQTILVPNVFDIGLTPSAADNSALATQRTMEYNAALAGTLADVEASKGIDLFEYDLFALSQLIAADPGAFGLSNITDPCTNGNVVFPVFPGSCDATVINEYAFIDDVHPTVTVHDFLGTEFFTTVIPTPAALPLLGSALFVIGIWLRRQRS